MINIFLKPRKTILCLIVFVMLFSSMSASSFAAPGDTMSIVTNASFFSVKINDYTNGVVTNGPQKVLLSFKNTSLNMAYSNIVLKDVAFRTSNGNTTTLSGTATVYFKKNGVNGTIISQASITNPMSSSGRIGSIIGMPLSAGNIALFPGETLDIVVSHNLKHGSNDVSVCINDWEANPKTDYYVTDWLIQSGVSASIEARDAANAANINAYNASYYGQAAANAANNANTSAQGAKTSADNAAARSQTTINQTWYNGNYGGASESVAGIAGYIRNTQIPGLETKINNLQTAVTNIQNIDTMPPTVKVQTISGARATSASSIPVVVSVTDNQSGPFTYQVNGGGWLALPSDGHINLPVNQLGINSIRVDVKDPSGNIGTEVIHIRKL
ncbi:hypothetical protein [Desulforamulus aquiferis]|uniref:Uncharacterized protein n=1 Tax=Desulforamulus aquiferis TaxID=1397668 RepID=A0AAW7Z708_9FIRM|nr:hypothetical protein [Desulforamulus aquiferis]MDO7785809.1 hypothetical protein [Desulforamulus aquiferis]